jgi:hypothetical protein
MYSANAHHRKILEFLAEEPADNDNLAKVRSNLGAAYLQTGQIKQVID